MSMISAQADELRELAGDGSMEWVAGPIRAATLRDAADTILSLRDRAQELQEENAKLREELEAVGTAAYLYGRDDLKTENSKLRKWCSDLLRMAESNDPEWLHWPELHDELRELGIEVG